LDRHVNDAPDLNGGGQRPVNSSSSRHRSLRWEQIVEGEARNSSFATMRGALNSINKSGGFT